MKEYTAVVERCLDSGLYVASIPGMPGAQAQGGSVDDAVDTLKEILTLMMENDALRQESEFVETRSISIG